MNNLKSTSEANGMGVTGPHQSRQAGTWPINQSQRLQPGLAENGVCQRHFLKLVQLNWAKSPSIESWSGYKEINTLRSCVVIDFTLTYSPCVVIEHLKMHNKHLVCRNAQQICKMPLWHILIVGLWRGYIFKEEFSLASFLPSTCCGNTNCAREVFKKEKNSPGAIGG